MKSKVLEILENYDKKTDGMCGVYPVKIQSQLGIQYKELKPILFQLYIDQSVTFHPGIQGQLIKINREKINSKT